MKGVPKPEVMITLHMVMIPEDHLRITRSVLDEALTIDADRQGIVPGVHPMIDPGLIVLECPTLIVEDLPEGRMIAPDNDPLVPTTDGGDHRGLETGDGPLDRQEIDDVDPQGQITGAAHKDPPGTGTGTIGGALRMTSGGRLKETLICK